MKYFLKTNLTYSWRTIHFDNFTVRQQNIHTLLSPLLLGAVNVVFELNAHLPLVGLISDKWVLQELLCGRTLCVILHQTALNKTEKLFGPVQVVKEKQIKKKNQQICSLLSVWCVRFMHVQLQNTEQFIVHAGMGRACKLHMERPDVNLKTFLL